MRASWIHWLRSCLAVMLVGAAMVGTGSSRAGDLYMVTAGAADLYLQGQVASRLVEGQIVTASPNPKKRDLLVVEYQGKNYDAKSSDFATKEAAATADAKRLADLDQKLAGLTQKIDAAKQTARELWYAIWAVKFDQAALFKIPTRVQVTPGAAAAASPAAAQPREPDTGRVASGTMTKGTVGKATVSSGARAAATTVPVPATTQRTGPGPVPGLVTAAASNRFNYQDKISATRARKLLRDLEKDLEQATQEIERLRSERLGALKEKVRIEETATTRNARFARYLADPSAEYLTDAYLTVTDGTQLYTGPQVMLKLPNGTAVTAKPAPKNRDWLVVWYQNKEYAGQAKDFRSRTSVLAESASVQRLSEQELADMDARDTERNDKTRVLLNLQQLLRQPATNGRYADIDAGPFAPDYPGQKLYAIPTCDVKDATQVLDTARAAHLFKECIDELKSLQTETQRLKISERKKELAATSVRLQDQLKRLEPAVPPGVPSPPPAPATEAVPPGK